MTAGYCETEHGEFKISFVQSFENLEEFLKADILRGHSQRTAELTILWNKCQGIHKDIPARRRGRK